MGDLQSVVQWLIDRSGPGLYPLLFCASVIENIFPPFPGDAFILAGAFLAGQGALHLPFVAASVWCGGMAGALVLYVVGRRIGHEAADRKWLRGLGTKKLDDLERWFEVRGAWLLIASRCIPAVRSAIALVAGMAKVRPLTFTVLTGVSFAIWNGVLLIVGVTLGSNLDGVAGFLVSYQRVMVVIVLMVAVVLVWRYIRSAKRARGGDV
jgi:membrane protein DedA with SNARE-associated domain